MRNCVMLVVLVFSIALLTVLYVNADNGGSSYAEIVSPPAFYYVQRSGLGEWVEIENPMLYPENIIVNRRYAFFSEGFVVRVSEYDSDWYEVLPESGVNPYGNLGDRIFIPTSSIEVLSSEEFQPINVFAGTLPEDKLIVVLATDNPEIALFEGNTLVMKVPVVLGPTPSGDFRVFKTTVSDDMPSVNGVPFTNYFTNGFAIHGLRVWNWRTRIGGGYGSHGCVNLPDSEWYNIRVGDRFVGVDEWVYRWISTNIDYDESDATVNNSYVSSTDPGWYSAIKSVRVIVLGSADEIFQYPPNSRLGGNNSSITSMSDIYQELMSHQNEWLFYNGQDSQVDVTTIPIGMSVAESEGDEDANPLVMLECDTPESTTQSAFEGSTRTVQEACNFMRTQISGSICFVERYDLEFFGKRIMCDRRRFESLPSDIRGELIQHESVHLQQFSGYFRELFLQGVSVTDPSIGYIDYQQITVIGIAELMAQTSNRGSALSNDYTFALATLSGDSIVPVNGNASTEQAWDHLIANCSNFQGSREELVNILSLAMLGDADAYLQANQLCILPLHRLVPDRIRNVN